MARRFNATDDVILHMLDGGVVVTAGEIADRAGVSDRTVYRRVKRLRGAGYHIRGEASVGFLLMKRKGAEQ